MKYITPTNRSFPYERSEAPQWESGVIWTYI